jgi:hypothetical protein
MRYCGLLFIALFSALGVAAQTPMYVVNGSVVESIDGIDHSIIESIDILPADEQTIARWGVGASSGVVVVTLTFDEDADFDCEPYSNFLRYVIDNVEWRAANGVAKVALRYDISEEGAVEVDTVLESTSRALLRKVLDVLEASPRWRPATRDGKAVRRKGLILNITLPEGARLSDEPYIVVR